MSATPAPSAILENVPQKARRGRPRLFDPEEEAIFGTCYPDLTHRRKQNFSHYLHALTTLWPFLDNGDEAPRDPRFEFLWNDGAPRETTLEAIGRLRDPDAMRTIAAEVSEQKLPARVAVPRIRCAMNIRRNGKGTASIRGLGRAIVSAMTSYELRHGRLTDADREAALHWALAIVKYLARDGGAA